ncbi:MAG: BrnT family toxin [Pseudomonadales bacterium]|nr:BrnT family toxin [Pseudomonadales bacterium]
MKHYAWNTEKNAELITNRGISFERIVYHIERDGLLDTIKHPNPSQYPNQKMFIVCISQYAYLVPFVESETEIFQKTIIPSRKATRKYIEVNKS